MNSRRKNAADMSKEAAGNEKGNKEISDALAVLAKHGRVGFYDPTKVSRGTAVGHAIWLPLDVSGCFDMAKEVLEEWNMHLAVAALDALNNGSFKHKGRKLTITLPEHWSD
jgi:hypothetical protein